MTGPFRQTDAVLTIVQDNAEKVIRITAANDAAANVTGFAVQDLVNKPFADIVPKRIAETLAEYVEFEEGANDVGEMLRKLRDFQILDKKDMAQPFRLRVMHHTAQSSENAFLLILQEEAEENRRATLTQMVQEASKAAERDPDTGLPGRSMVLKGLEHISVHAEDLPGTACFGVLEVDGYDALLAKYGIQACHKMMRNMATWCQQDLRDNDMVGQLDQKHLGVILPSVDETQAKMVLNRLRWLVSSQTTRVEAGELQSSATIVFMPLHHGETAEKVVSRLEKTLAEKPEDAVNLVLTAG